MFADVAGSLFLVEYLVEYRTPPPPPGGNRVCLEMLTLLPIHV